MPDAQKQFELLAAEFEMLCGEVEICQNTERRFAPPQRMKILMDEIFRLLCTSLNKDNQQRTWPRNSKGKSPTLTP
jgi:hypothetical protein